MCHYPRHKFPFFYYQKGLVVLLFCLFSSVLLAQAPKINADSLEKILETSISDTTRIRILLRLSSHYNRLSTHLAKSTNYAQKAIQLAENLPNDTLIARSYYQMSQAYIGFSNYAKVIENAFKALKIAEKINDKSLITNILHDISFVYRLSGDFDKAIFYAQKGLTVCQTFENKRTEMILLKAMGDALSKQGKYDSALIFLQKNSELAQKLKQGIGIAAAQNAMGIIERQQGKYDSARRHHEQALAFYQKAKLNGAEIITLNNLAQVYLAQNQLVRAEEYATQAFTIAQKVKIFEFIKNSSEILHQIHSKKGEFEKSLLYFQTATAMKDSLFSTEKAKIISQMQAGYDFEKQEQEIALLNKDKALKNTILTALGGILVLVLGILILVYWHSTQRKKANQLLTEKNKQIATQNHAIMTQHEELQQQQEEIIAQRDFIDKTNQELQEKNKTVEESILAARSIQYALMPQKYVFDENFADHFVMYKPKDLVSGDFYWTYSDEKSTLLAVVDCTGHGVPGAFTAIVGTMLLNRIVRAFRIVEPAQILSQLQTEIARMMVQNHSEEIRNDIGMDLVIVNIQKLENERIVRFAGAKRPLFCFDFQNQDFKSFPPTRQSIKNWHHKEEKDKLFTETEVRLSAGSVLYLSSDGFSDQNNLQRNSIGTKNFAKILEENAHLPLSEQKKRLEQYFESYKMGVEQRDDVLVVGVQL